MISSHGKSIHFKRAFSVKVDTLFSAWSRPEIFKTWWKDLQLAEMDFRQGGTYKLEWKTQPGNFTTGTYREIDTNRKIVMSWDSPNCANGAAAIDSLLTISFTSTSPTTSMLELTHEFLPAASIDDHHLGWTCALLDLDSHLNAPLRQIREDLKVAVSRTVAAPIATVWSAWTDPALMQKWFNRKGATMGRAETNLQVGRNFFMDYQAKTGDVLRVYGEYLEIVPMQKLVFTWADDNIEKTSSLDKGYESRVTVQLTNLNQSTRIDITHDRLASSDVMKEFEAGWSDCVKSIEEELLALA